MLLSKHHPEPRVLLIEDTEDTRELSRMALESQACHVVGVSSAEAALGLLAAGERFDLLFTDVVMPGRIKSTDLAEWARAQSPPVAVLFTSGHTRDILSSNHLLSADIHLLSKPYSPEALTQRLRSVLTARQGCS